MAGFEEVEIMTKPVSREYEERWGRTLSIGEYIMSSAITAKKPVTNEGKEVTKNGYKSNRYWM